ncbi:methyl-accepting chemotaxis protein [Dethiosulfovibrio sp. F2B]|uniref:methyl-accepting chemotaxis protein n=1 Tax=Dethiosulfovibrio faecalis TaxID=2720018 RepID=UPI001F42DDA7|nr:methyl-accepting chemotaxis protein [Dethiosulfovibrio faecalis]
MNLLRQVSIRVRLFVLVGIMLTFSVLTSVYLVGVVEDTCSLTERLHKVGAMGAVTAYRVSDGMNQALVNLYRALNATDKDKRKVFGEGISKGKAAMNDALGRLGEIPMSDGARKEYEEAVEASKEWVVMLDSLIDVIDRGESRESFMAIASSGVNLTVRLDKEVKELVVIASNSMEDVFGDIQDETSSSKRVVVIVIAVTALLSLALASLVVLSISRPIDSMVRNIKKVGEERDLSHRGKVVGRDEISSILVALNGLFDAVEYTMKEIKEMSCELSGQAQTFSATAEEANSTVEEVYSHVDHTGDMVGGLAAGAEEINASVQEVAAGSQAAAKKSSDVAEQVGEARHSGEDGLESVRKAVRAVIKVADESRSSMEKVKDLGSRAQQIQSFVTDIGSIADQTNLLALNAAIEAARAGEHGRGFAVVAEEVRKLAEESNSSAAKISDLAKEIAGDLQAVITLVEANEGQATEARQDAEGAEVFIGNILQSLANIEAAAQDMAAVSEEQAASSQEISSAVQDMAEKTNDVSDSTGGIREQMRDVSSVAEQIAIGSESLAEMAEKLQTGVDRFKISETSSLAVVDK